MDRGRYVAAHKGKVETGFAWIREGFDGTAAHDFSRARPVAGDPITLSI